MLQVTIHFELRDGDGLNSPAGVLHTLNLKQPLDSDLLKDDIPSKDNLRLD